MVNARQCLLSEDGFARIGSCEGAKLRYDQSIVCLALQVSVTLQNAILVCCLAVLELESVQHGQTVKQILHRCGPDLVHPGSIADESSLQPIRYLTYGNKYTVYALCRLYGSESD